jgi:hypothetical protein
MIANGNIEFLKKLLKENLQKIKLKIINKFRCLKKGIDYQNKKN